MRDWCIVLNHLVDLIGQEAMLTTHVVASVAEIDTRGCFTNDFWQSYEGSVDAFMEIIQIQMGLLGHVEEFGNVVNIPSICDKDKLFGNEV